MDFVVTYFWQLLFFDLRLISLVFSRSNDLFRVISQRLMSLVFVSPILHSEALGARLLDAFFVVARMTILTLNDVIKLERKERIS